MSSFLGPVTIYHSTKDSLLKSQNLPEGQTNQYVSACELHLSACEWQWHPA